MPSDKISCPVCGTAMNHHADKLIYISESATGDTGELIEELHQCPTCGAAASLPAAIGDPA
jgi:ribosomal protein S27AE